ncbi:MAG: PaaI family thioesterase [Steroidobacteraceae bacterium]
MTRSLTVSWSDPLQVAQAARSLSGIDFLRGMRDGTIRPAPIQELIGMKLVEVDPGRAVWEVVPGEQHHNPIGTVHAASPRRCSTRPWPARCHGGKSTAIAEGRLEDASGALYAHATATCLLLG